MKIKDAAIAAQLANLDTFKHDKSCRVCGGTERYSSSTTCVKCHRDRAIKAYVKLGSDAKKKARERAARWRKENREYYSNYQKARYMRKKEESEGLRFL